MTKILPKCHMTVDSDDITRGIAYTSTGYLLPCCWHDFPENKALSHFDLLNPKLKLENCKSVEEILLSKQWVAFHKTILLHQENAPEICKRYCSIDE